MKLDDLKKRGAFVSATPVPKEVSWTHFDDASGEETTDTFTVFVIRQSFGFIERLFAASDEQSRAARFISECMRFGEDAGERMSYDDAYRLDPGLAAVLVAAINDVNSTGRAAPKN